MRPRPCSPGGYERRSTAHFSVRQRSPLRKSFMPSRRQSLHLGPRDLPIRLSYASWVGLRSIAKNAAHFPRRSCSCLDNASRQTLLRFFGRTPLWACGETSRTPRISSPAAWRERMAVSRPDPGPLTNTSTFWRPCSIPLRAQESAVTCAANGVDLRDPLKPADPALSQAMTLPSRSVSVTIVLLKDVLMCAWPTAMFFLARRRARPFVAAGLRGGATQV